MPASLTISAIRVEGGLIPADLLARILAGDSGLEGLEPASYGLLSTERVREAASRSWTRLIAAWQHFRAALEKLPESDPATTLTRERWLQPLFQELGYGKLAPARGLEAAGKTFSISHRWSHVPIHLVGARVELDQRSAQIPGAARTSPHGLVQEYLNKSEHTLWGIVTNGRVLRLLRDHASLTRDAHIEFDLEEILTEQSFSGFLLLWLLAHATRFEAEKPQECILERWRTVAAAEGARALEELRGGVQRAIEALGSGFIVSHPDNEGLRDRLRSGALSRDDLFRQCLRLVYRLLFLFAAEDRGLLLDPAAPDEARRRYRAHYSTAALRERARATRGSRHGDQWISLRLVMEALGREGGEPRLALPALGSFLWSPEAAPDLAACHLPNEALFEAVRSLAFREVERKRRPVDFKHLGTEELGSVYESLLELHPVLDLRAATFELASAAGHERKTTGSYYTPTSLIECLLDSALEPVLERAARERDAQAAILRLRVIDPACGSGHFLLAAAHRIARRLAAVRTGDEEPAPQATRAALREVIAHCIYGVDLNPWAVELCKVSLWLESIEPGKPFAFLEHRIVCGNSLLGAVPALLAKGIPDEAFAPLEGDDKAICRELGKRNRAERGGQTTMFADADVEAPAALGTLRRAHVDLERLDDRTFEQLQQKERAWKALQQLPEARYAKLAADAWCAAFVQRRDKKAPAAITEGVLRALARDPKRFLGSASGVAVSTEVDRLAATYRFLHPHLAFPEVFTIPDQGAESAPPSGWTGGFDVVLGNPPWERIKLQEKEWFAVREPSIAQAPSAAARRKKIEALESEDPELLRAFRDAQRSAEAESHFVRQSGRYPLCGRGDVNTYTIFAETMRNLLGSQGRVGVIVPSGIATDDTTKHFFQSLVETRSLASLFDFENRKGIFPAVDSRVKFALLTLQSFGSSTASSTAAQFVFFAQDVHDLDVPERRFTLSADDFALLNPNTRTCPIFRTSRDAEITKAIYRRVPILVKEGPPEENPWGVQFSRLFDMSNDSALFRTKEELQKRDFTLEGNIFIPGVGAAKSRAAKGGASLAAESPEERWLPLYEGRLGHQFDHRYASEPGGNLRTTTVEEHGDPLAWIEPQYWVSNSEAVRRLERQNPACRTGLLGHRRVARNTDERTSIATILPYGAASYGWILSLGPEALDLLILCATYNSFAFDFLIRSKFSQPSIPQSTFEQVPVLPKFSITRESRAMIEARVLELVYTSFDLQPFARDCGFNGPPFRWDEERRFQLRCELDAAFFHLYGLSRDEAAYILDTFPIVRRHDESRFGEYRTQRVILEFYDRFTAR
ncbi:MAG: N-6 DNA methylase [Planctomycetes bacterium]|nr:N-6 DNA methylase [Planctomycetota bacterium]